MLLYDLMLTGVGTRRLQQMIEQPAAQTTGCWSLVLIPLATDHPHLRRVSKFAGSPRRAEVGETRGLVALVAGARNPSGQKPRQTPMICCDFWPLCLPQCVGCCTEGSRRADAARSPSERVTPQLLLTTGGPIGLSAEHGGRRCNAPRSTIPAARA